MERRSFCNGFLPFAFIPYVFMEQPPSPAQSTSAAVIKEYFLYTRRTNLAQLEQLLIKKGTPAADAAPLALDAYEQFLHRLLKANIMNFVMVLIALLTDVLLLPLIFSQTSPMSTRIMVYGIILFSSVILVRGLTKGVKLFALKEEITAFRELRNL